MEGQGLWIKGWAMAPHSRPHPVRTIRGAFKQHQIWYWQNTRRDKKAQHGGYAWNWLLPIPGTLNNSRYSLKQSGTSPSGGIGEDIHACPSLPPRHSICTDDRLDDWLRTRQDTLKGSSSTGIFGIFRCSKIVQSIAVQLALLQVHDCRANGGGGLGNGGKRVWVSIWHAKGRAKGEAMGGIRCGFCTD